MFHFLLAVPGIELSLCFLVKSLQKGFHPCKSAPCHFSPLSQTDVFAFRSVSRVLYLGLHPVDRYSFRPKLHEAESSWSEHEARRGGVVWQQRRCFLSMSTLTVTGRIYLLTARMQRTCNYSNKSSLNTHTSSECYIKICIALLLSQFQMYFIVFSWLVLVSERVCSLPLIFLQQPFTRWHFNLSA